MKFRTEIEPLRHQGLISHNTAIVLLGSCFTTEVGGRLQNDLFDATVNPMGALYNPASIAALMERAAGNNEFTSEDIIEHGGMFHTFHSHSVLSTARAEETLAIHNSCLHELRRALERSGMLIVTLGTAWVFRLRSSGMVVANCHKLPADMFERVRLTVDECTDCLRRIRKAALSINPDVKLMLTVSPIRHAADGLHGNQLSKATLLLAAEAMGLDALYFPSYEIMMDDLRDYRFYASDMLHPSDTAVDYVYEKFAESFFDASTVQLAKECRALAKRLRHRTMSVSDEAVSAELAGKRAMVKEFVSRYPHMHDLIKTQYKHIL